MPTASISSDPLGLRRGAGWCSHPGSGWPSKSTGGLLHTRPGTGDLELPMSKSQKQRPPKIDLNRVSVSIVSIVYCSILDVVTLADNLWLSTQKEGLKEGLEKFRDELTNCWKSMRGFGWFSMQFSNGLCMAHGYHFIIYHYFILIQNLSNSFHARISPVT